MAVADVLVAIHVGAERSLGIVGVNRDQAVEPNSAVHFLKGLGNAVRRGNVIPSAVQVAGVPTHREALIATEPLDNVGQLLKADAERLALASTHLEDNPGLGLGLGEDTFEGANHAVESLIVGSAAGRARMKDEACGAHPAGPGDLADERVSRLLVDVGPFGRQVDEIDAVNEDRTEVECRYVVAELFDLSRGGIGWPPGLWTTD